MPGVFSLSPSPACFAPGRFAVQKPFDMNVTLPKSKPLSIHRDHHAAHLPLCSVHHYQGLLMQHGVIQSIYHHGTDCHDPHLENLFGILKSQLSHCHPCRIRREPVRGAVEHI